MSEYLKQQTHTGHTEMLSRSASLSSTMRAWKYTLLLAATLIQSFSFHFPFSILMSSFERRQLLSLSAKENYSDSLNPQEKVAAAVKVVRGFSIDNNVMFSSPCSPPIVCIHCSDTPASSSPSSSQKTRGIFSNRIIASISAALASVLFFIQYTNPVSNIALLHAMEADSKPLNVAFCNGKPTLIDFYADWCESCKLMAPTMRQLEVVYGDKINFVTIDGTKAKNAGLVDRFQVDAIPQVSLLSADLDLQVSLVGAVPPNVLEQDIAAVLNHKSLPYEGYSQLPNLLSDVKAACQAD